jgi:hypothetical protein
MAASNGSPGVFGTGASEVVHPARANAPKLNSAALNSNRPSFGPKGRVMSAIRRRLSKRWASECFDATGPLHKYDPPARQIDPVTVFRARCKARALLRAAGEVDLYDAVDTLQTDAVRTGLVESIGQDAVQALMADAFEERELHHDVRPEAQGIGTVAVHNAGPELDTELQSTRTPSTTVQALMYGLRRGLSCLEDPGNRDRLRRCDAPAMKEIAGRLLRCNWQIDDVERLIDAWRAIGGKS